MSYTSITAAARDKALNDRTLAAVQKEARSNPDLAATEYGKSIINGQLIVAPIFAYPVAIEGEAAYESALAAGNPNPGGDPAVITDAQILGVVQLAWPPDPEEAPAP
jgi:hypothetical protein